MRTCTTIIALTIRRPDWAQNWNLPWLPLRLQLLCERKLPRQIRRRPNETVLRELDGLIEQGVDYVYFVDEIFLPNRELLEEMRQRKIQFGIQTRIDLWKPDLLDLLGEAGCVSIEAGIESISDLGRRLLNKNCMLDSDELKSRLVHARRTIPFVQASLLDSQVDDPDTVEQWRQELITDGVWANKPVPMFPYPGSPGYTQMWGPPDSQAWERAHEQYLSQIPSFSDIQEDRPLALSQLESTCAFFQNKNQEKCRTQGKQDRNLKCVENF